ncbi:MAG TPA: dihydrolipoamide acetyltransferase family protein [Chthonomonadaceae bacterium]|nr:dihydrolipoamide acetyltransferase family protein [Chthonomonadaceae bacterium]
MAQIFNMPQLGSTMEEGTILRWHKREGDPVKKGEILLEIETDKASMEVEAPTDGALRKILASEGALVPIRQPIAILGTADEPIERLLAEVGAGNGSTVAQEARPAAVSSPAPTAEAATPLAGAGAGTAADSKGKVFISPRASRIADEHGVSLSALAGRGTGPEGRIIERDVRAYLEAQQARETPPAAPMEAEPARPTPRATPLAARMADELGISLEDLATGLPGSRVRSADVLRHVEAVRPTAEPAPAAAPAVPSTEGVTVQPFAGMRRRIAENVARSAFTAPHVTLTLEVDMTEAAEFRSRLIPEVEKAYGVRLSYTDILIKAVARALGEHPRLNAALIGDEIRLYAQKNIGVAVALEDGLIAPVVRDADKKSLGTVSAELKQLVDRARSGKFTPDDLAGGTFTLTNLGTFGIDVFDPIIVPPQAAILGVGRIADKPVVINKEIVVRTMMNLCLSFDHRILDGAPAARFLQRVKELLENPMLILV